MTSVVSRKTPTSQISAAATNTAGRHRCVSSLMTRNATPLNAIAEGVSASVEKNPDTLFSLWFRCAASPRFTASSALIGQVCANGPVTSHPITTSTANTAATLSTTSIPNRRVRGRRAVLADAITSVSPV
jgi:hypothetical protein